MWKQRLAEYREAKSRHDDAVRLMNRAGRTFEKLAKRIGDRRPTILRASTWQTCAESEPIKTWMSPPRRSRNRFGAHRCPLGSRRMAPLSVPICPALQTTAEAIYRPAAPGGLSSPSAPFCKLRSCHARVDLGRPSFARLPAMQLKLQRSSKNKFYALWAEDGGRLKSG